MPLDSKLKRNTEVSVSSSQLQKIGQLHINRSSRSLSVSKYRNLIANSINRAKHEERRLPSKKAESSFISRRTPDISFDASMEYDKLERLTNRYESARNDLLVVQQKVLEFGLREKLNGKLLYEVTEESEVSFSKLDKSFDDLVGRCFQRQDGLPRLPRGSPGPVRV
mmetsp:Transcript_23440/g.41563  ORF Transcript_23440/g.41563 Transcript_23440/m.41563 type:complete len:167 (+) Transcript_23440:89-589(+)|eukprot:CAMPEP_0204901294 /NCGR_PEP_ID=MMETSP1397-20131031/3004_1 /ASSEMBLY_ACC=CAM_ASM_000891 /TAXON_ID=49980 /ORGANISM="Climacostomum Climacostomum virens, Strain Stock W-24" /LENGTH=166 /DNA_ID=CAMNT_0052069639 /DNA_START=89 /DNA_END=589 /DNA_ORIENTATION=+